MNLKMASINNRKGNENNKSTGLILKLSPLAHQTLPLYRYATQREN